MRRGIKIDNELWTRVLRAAGRQTARLGTTVSASQYVREAIEMRLDAEEREVEEEERKRAG